jgi:nucleotide-binding universal stress UspA family protein
MNTIIAATDMSANSRPALRYALQLAATINAKLHIVNVYNVLRASMWTDAQYEFYRTKTQQVLTNELEAFVKSVRPDCNHVPINYETALYHHLDTVKGIIEYARQQQAKYICVGTHGAGMIAKLMGTITEKLIRQSEIPVIALPAAYRQRKITTVLYASDMSDYEEELEQVVEFARPLGATVSLLHLYYAFEFKPDKELMEQSLKQKFRYKINVHYWPRNPKLNLTEDIRHHLKSLNPSVLAMFTNQEQDFLERLIAGSSTQHYSLISKVPLLSFAKRTSQLSRKQQEKTGAPLAA